MELVTITSRQDRIGPIGYFIVADCRRVRKLPAINGYNVRPPFDSQVGANNSNNYMVYGTYNDLVTGANLNQLSYLGGLTL